MELWGITPGDRETARCSTYGSIGLLLKKAYQTSRLKCDYKKLDILIDKLGGDKYLKDQFSGNKRGLSKRYRLIVGSAVSRKKWLIRMLLWLESMIE
jgi:hypothetical protein